MIYLFLQSNDQTFPGGITLELNDLGLDYLIQAEILRKRVYELKNQLPQSEGLEHIVLKRRLSSLISDMNECIRIGNRLIQYYKVG